MTTRGPTSDAPGDVFVGGLPFDGVEEERSRAVLAGALELGDGSARFGEIEHRDRMQSVGFAGELFGQEVVATSDALRGRSSPRYSSMLPPPTRVHEAVIDPDPIHPLDALGAPRTRARGCRIVGAARVLGRA